MSARCDNATDALLIVAAPATNQPLTIAGWMQRAAVSAGAVVVAAIVSGSGFEQTLLMEAGANELAIYNSRGPSTALPYFDVTDGSWIYVASVRSGDTQTLIVDGVAISAFTDAAAIGPNTIVALGGDTSALGMNGRLAHWRLWEAALTVEELFRERQNIVAMRTANLWADWPLDTDALDISGNARHLSEFGSIVYEAGPPIGERRTAFQMNAF